MAQSAADYPNMDRDVVDRVYLHRRAASQIEAPPSLAFSPLRFSRYAQELSNAVYRLSEETSERTRMATIAEQLKAVKARHQAVRQRAESCVAQANNIADLTEKQIELAEKETEAMLAEMAELTNGGPPLDDTPKANVTPLPPVGPAVSYP